MEPDASETVASQPPRRIGRYEIIGELGRGAMGVVHKGFDPTIGRTVAIKTVLASHSNEDLLKRFRREAQAAGVLSHPNIVTIYDAGEEKGVFYIAMEYVEGETLERIISRGPMALEDVTRIIEDVGSALDHAHARQIIHRDIKPANIMITGGKAKVMDFGVAKVTSSTATATGMVIGTPSYMSPEGVKGLPVDGRADIFSLGVVLYEMITAKRPFAGDSIPSVIYKIIGEQPAPPTTVNPKLHSGLDVVLGKALAKEPADRYGHCAELVKDLRDYRTLQPQLATAPPLGPPRVALTLAPPFVSGTVAMEPGTVVSPPPTVVVPQPAAVAPQSSPRAAGKPSGSRSWLAPLLVLAVVAAAAAGGVWWKGQQDARRAQQEEAARAAAAAQSAKDAAANVAKPSPTGEPAIPPDRLTDQPPERSGATPTPPPARAEKPQKAVEKPAPPPPAPAEGRLRILTFPPNAEVMVDGADTIYRTPVNMLLPAGHHKILLKHKRTSNYSRDMVVVANEIVELAVNLFNPDKPLPPLPQIQRRVP
jgi:eukaryotic-like serine/threonine-protein kinase